MGADDPAHDGDAEQRRLRVRDVGQGREDLFPAVRVHPDHLAGDGQGQIGGAVRLQRDVLRCLTGLEVEVRDDPRVVGREGRDPSTT
ncbi:hypothetical protein [Streptomyces sp. NPDC049949]|uniref:hypothetical protein n=1 Tax=Streptomyces sp. NPDC049949 TaxID=3154627 RepID=UPI003443D2F0